MHTGLGKIYILHDLSSKDQAVTQDVTQCPTFASGVETLVSYQSHQYLVSEKHVSPIP